MSEQLRYITYAIPQSTYTTVATDLMPLSVRMLQACVGLSANQILDKTVIALLAALHEH